MWNTIIAVGRVSTFVVCWLTRVGVGFIVVKGAITATNRTLIRVDERFTGLDRVSTVVEGKFTRMKRADIVVDAESTGSGVGDNRVAKREETTARDDSRGAFAETRGIPVKRVSGWIDDSDDATSFGGGPGRGERSGIADSGLIMPTTNKYWDLPDAQLAQWANHFSDLLNSDPESYSISIETAEAYAAAASDYAAKQAAAINANTRGPASCFAKSQSRRALIKLTRQVAGIIHAAIDVTDEQRQALGLHVRESTDVSVINAPMIAPIITVQSVNGRMVTLRFSDPTSPDARRRPRGVQGITIFSCVGPTPAQTNADGWRWRGQTGRKTATVTLENSVPAGSKIWFCGVYYNPRGENGPFASPVSSYLPMEDAAQAA